MDMDDIYDGVLGIDDDPFGFDHLVNGDPVTDFDLLMAEADSVDKASMLLSLHSVLHDMVLTKYEERPDDFREFESVTPVLSSGNPDADILVVARDLGRQELEQKQILIGDAGQIFRRALSDAGFDPLKDVYMTNVVPFKPRNNQAFSQKIVDEYSWVLESQINIIKPKIFITLGNEAMRWISNRFFGKRWRTGVTKKSGSIVKKGRKSLLVMVHPSYVLRAGGINTPEYGKYMQMPLMKLKGMV